VFADEIEKWNHFFKPESRKAGDVFVKKGKVTLSYPSDTDIQGYVRAATSFKFVFYNDSFESPTLVTSCTCPQFKKGQFCKHLWAALVVIHKKYPDFLSSKSELGRKVVPANEYSVGVKSSNAGEKSQEAYKLRQAEYRKQNYQKQKQRIKEKKQSKKSNSVATSFPLEVEKAFAYFSENGFSLRDSLKKEAVSVARKKLANIFHPDRGGSHSEILELNHHTEVLISYAKE
jgi:hypothetical protein